MAGKLQRMGCNGDDQEIRMGTYQTKLSNGESVTLADWSGMTPTNHGDALLEKPWDPSHKREGLAFYDSTVNFLRNEHAVETMPTVTFMHDSKTYRLYMNESTATWHSADAMDIDHTVQWKDHLIAKRVDNYADANMAYNDTDNLRLLPSVYNRSRDKVDKLLEDHGLESAQWQKWRKANVEFDPNAPHIAFDPEKHNAKRQSTTLEAEWGPEDGRKGLHFDARVKSIWVESQLAERYAVTLDIPVTHDGNTTTHSVPMFYCATTEQLVTRDAFDIDHKRPISEVLAEMCEQSPTGKISKAEALDAYNDVSNLQLVGRSANCSHEWERDINGEFDGDYDFGVDDLDDYIDRRPATVIAQEGLQQEQRVADAALLFDFAVENNVAHNLVGDDLPETGRKRGRAEMEQGALDTNPLQQGNTPERKRINPGPAEPLGELPPLLNDVRHPQNGLFVDARAALDRFDASGALFPNQQARDNIASTLAVEAERGRLPRIDHVLTNQDASMIFATAGDPRAESSANVGISSYQAMTRSVWENTQAMNALPVRPVQTQSGAEQQVQFHM
jgi:hypothetical protein